MMSTIDLKASLHELIEQEDDNLVLNYIRQMLEEGRNFPADELGGQTIDEFNEEMNEAEREIDDGEFSTQEQVTARFEQLFRK